MASTPVHTPESVLTESECSSEEESDEETEAMELCGDLEIGRTVVRFLKQHSDCPHDDEMSYLTRELEHFKSRDVLVKDSDGKLLGGVPHTMDAPVSSIYRWMEMIYQPATGWSLMRISDNCILSRTDKGPISKGEYCVVDSSLRQVKLQRTLDTFQLRPFSHGGTPEDILDHEFADEVLRRDHTDSMTGMIQLPEVVEGSDYVRSVKLWTQIDYARIYPAAWAEQWVNRLPPEERKEEQRVREHLKILNSPANGISLYREFHHTFLQYCWGFDVKDDYRVIWFTNVPATTKERNYRLQERHRNSTDAPSDEILEEHFKMCLLRYFAGDPSLELADANNHFRAIQNRYRFTIDLSEDCWTRGVGKQVLELFLSMQLFSTLLSSFDAENEGSKRWTHRRLAKLAEIQTPVEDQVWPDTFETPFNLPTYEEYGDRLTWVPIQVGSSSDGQRESQDFYVPRIAPDPTFMSFRPENDEIMDLETGEWRKVDLSKDKPILPGTLGSGAKSLDFWKR